MTQNTLHVWPVGALIKRVGVGLRESAGQLTSHRRVRNASAGARINNEKSQYSISVRHRSSSSSSQLPSTITTGAVTTIASSTGSCVCRSYCGRYCRPLLSAADVAPACRHQRFPGAFVRAQVMRFQPDVVVMKSIHRQRLDRRHPSI